MHLNDTHLSSQQIFLSSKHANTKHSDGHCIWNLNAPINPPTGTKILMAVTDFEVPYSFYVFNNTNNVLAFTGKTPLTIANGNYDVDTLVTYLNTNLSSQGITASYITAQNHLKFTSAGSISINNTNTTCHFELGFTTSDNQNSTSIQSTQSVNLAGVPAIYIRIKNITTNNIDSNGSHSSTLAKVNVTAHHLEWIYYSPSEYIYQLLHDHQFNHIELALENDEGKVIDLNGANWSIVLTIHYQIKRNAIRNDMESIENKNEELVEIKKASNNK